jgi:hypothetical protein
MLSRCAVKALDALRKHDPARPFDIPRLAAAIGSAPHDTRAAVSELERAGDISIETRVDCRRYVVIAAAPKQHCVTVEPADKGFSVRGAVSIPSTKAPVVDAAKALREAGAPDGDILLVSGSCVSVLPVTIGAALKPFKTVAQTHRLYHAGAGNF